MHYLDFRVARLTRRSLRRFKKRPRFTGRAALAVAANVALWTAASVGFGYVASQDWTPPPPQPMVPPVVQAVPPSNSQSMPACTPSVFFLNKPHEGDLGFSLSVRDEKGNSMDLTNDAQLVLLQSEKGNPIVVLVSRLPYPEGSTVTATILQRDSPDPALGKAEFTVASTDPAGFPGELVSERPIPTFSGQGDFVVPELGPISARTGLPMAQLSTGGVLGRGALAETTSVLTLGPLSEESKRLRFDFNFTSSEFDKYVGTEYDDAFLVVIAGPRGAEARLVASVNFIGREASVPVEFQGLPEKGENPPQETGWRTFSVATGVGAPMCVSFVVTDVGDQQVTSVVTIDALRIERRQ